jgi:hypothetical protein
LTINSSDVLGEGVASFFQVTEFNLKRIVPFGAAYLLRMLNPDGRLTSSNSNE